MGASQPRPAAQPPSAPTRSLRAYSSALALCAGLLGLTILGLYRFAGRFSVDVKALFAKEGPLEILTFVAASGASIVLVSAGRKALAAARLLPHARIAAHFYFVTAAIVFVVGMEEISWGQQFFHFMTPARWAQINHQQETTLHNLLDRDALETSAHWIAYAVAFGALAAASLREMSDHALVRWIAPSHHLLPLAFVIGVAGWKSHSEVIEVLIAMYSLCYACDAYTRLTDESVSQAPCIEPRSSRLFALRKPLRDRVGR